VAATALLDKLMASPELRNHPETPIAFVCHSLGGLIIKKLVVTAYLDQGQAPLKGKFLDRIAGVVFLAAARAVRQSRAVAPK
jgi:triacylglycerol esterase/lipase EstA (alpha/beta hydrolase family)